MRKIVLSTHIEYIPLLKYLVVKFESNTFFKESTLQIIIKNLSDYQIFMPTFPTTFILNSFAWWLGTGLENGVPSTN